ncbi:MAG: alpha/beta fold hydrolase [Chitinophagaceae bacterium]
MKKVLSILSALLMISLVTTAQFDDKFYFPSTNVRPIDSAGTLNVEKVTLRTDTVSLTAVWLTPKSKPKATILFFHGAGGNVSTYMFMARPMVQDGYQVLLVDFRGYGNSTGKPTHLNIAKDAQLFFDYLLNRKEVAGTKIIVLGASIGTQVATKLAHDNQSKVAGLVLDSPMSSFTDIAMFYAPKEQHQSIQQILKSPYSAKDDIKYLTQIPVLVLHGREDKECPFEMSQTVYNAAPGKKDFWAYTGGHLEAMKLYPQEYLQHMNGLLQ